MKSYKIDDDNVESKVIGVDPDTGEEMLTSFDKLINNISISEYRMMAVTRFPDVVEK